VGFGIPEFLGQTEIDDINLITTLSDAHEEIIRFDVAVNKVSRVDVFDSRDLEDRCS